VLADPYLTYDASGETVVIAIKSELIVHSQALQTSPKLEAELRHVADQVGTLATPVGDQSFNERGQRPVAVAKSVADGAASEVELWRLRDPERMDSIDQARRLRRIAEGWQPGDRCGRQTHELPAVTPHHVGILSPKANGCPAGPPFPAPQPPPFFGPFQPSVRVTVLDSGYLPGLHPDLDPRVGFVDGSWFNAQTRTWVPDAQTDETYLAQAQAAGRLDGLTGHGTFIAGLIAHIAPEAELTVVGLRDQELPLPDGQISPLQQKGLFASELSIAHALLRYSDVQVIQCGFAFPTLDDYPSLPFVKAIEQLEQAGNRALVVAPAGNESSHDRYWPAALPQVIGVAATDRRDAHRADFSNWGEWCDCCARGEYVLSAFLDFTGEVEGEGSDVETFSGWAHWDGTSFSAPKVSAAIARRAVLDGVSAREAWNLLRSEAVAAGRVVWDHTLTPAGIGLPNLG
jgi:hypothetical protein